jgi:hypothetical protein
MIGQILQLIPFIMKLLTGAGIIKDPETEKEIRLKLIDLAAQKDIQESKEFEAFIQATSPNAQYVWPVINSLTALTRPALTWIVMGSIIAAFWKDGVAERIAFTLAAFSNAGTAGLLFLAIPAWWFFGRSIERIVPGMSIALNGNGNGNGNGKPAPASPPPHDGGLTR